MAFKKLYLLSFMCLLNNNDGCLLNSTTEPPGSGATTLEEKHFYSVMDLISEEKKSNDLLKEQLKQMVTFVVNLRNDLQSVKTELNSVKTELNSVKTKINSAENELNSVKNELNSTKTELNNCKQVNVMNLSKDIETLKNETWQLTQKYAKLDGSNLLLRNSIKKVDMENQYMLVVTKAKEKRISDYETKTLKSDVASLTNLASVPQFQNSTLLQSRFLNLNEQMRIIKTQVSFLSSSVNSHNKKFIALLNQTHSADQKTKTMEAMQNSTTVAVKDVLQQISKLNDSVALTVCVRFGINVNGGDVVKFTSIKTAQGISDTNAVTATGKFKCERPGLYIFSVFIMSSSTYAEYGMYRNDERIVYTYIAGEPKDIKDFHTGSGTVVLQLNAGDTLYVKAIPTLYVFGANYSCLNVIRI